MKRILIIAGIAIWLFGCNKYTEVSIPSAGPNSILSETYPLTDTSRSVMNGIYKVTAGSERFGDQVVLIWSRKNLTVCCSNGNYCVLDAGQLDSVVMLQGYWRYAFNDETGLVTGYIGRAEGGTDILKVNTTPSKIIIRGGYGSSGNEVDNPLQLEYVRPIAPAMLWNGFNILAHRSGGRTSDRLPVSENSIAMINFTEGLSSTGIEIDIQLTKDGIPVLYHDDDINIRLCQKGPISGPIHNYTYAQLYYLVTLVHGEKIPTLEDALRFVVDSTKLRMVYLDMKENVNSMSAVIPIQQEMLQRAKDQGRDLHIYIGIPSSTAKDDFMAQPGYLDIPSLCELTTDDVEQLNSHVWAPRWTEGTQNEGVDAMHAQGRIAWCWTLDQIQWIQKFIDEGHFDGILTNYPFIVSYYHYIRTN